MAKWSIRRSSSAPRSAISRSLRMSFPASWMLWARRRAQRARGWRGPYYWMQRRVEADNVLALSAELRRRDARVAIGADVHFYASREYNAMLTVIGVVPYGKDLDGLCHQPNLYRPGARLRLLHPTIDRLQSRGHRTGKQLAETRCCLARYGGSVARRAPPCRAVARTAPSSGAQPKVSSLSRAVRVLWNAPPRTKPRRPRNTSRIAIGTDMNSRIAILAAVACFASAPSTAQTFSFDPLKDLESAIPSGVPNESRILQARLQVKEMAQDALASLYEPLPGRDAASRRRQATPCSARSA